MADGAKLAFGIKVVPKMITVPARVLPPGSVQYKNKGRPTAFVTANGNWDLRGGRAFSEAKRLQKWTFINFDRSNVNPQDIDGFRGIIRNSGMDSENPTPPEGISNFIIRGGRAFQDADDKVIREAMEHAARRGLKILLVLLPDKSAFIYSRVKFWAEVKNGM